MNVTNGIRVMRVYYTHLGMHRQVGFVSSSELCGKPNPISKQILISCYKLGSTRGKRSHYLLGQSP